MSTITVLDVGATPNDGTGDTLRTAMQAVNANFAALNTDKVEFTLTANLDVGAFGVISSGNANITITPNGSGRVVLDGITFNFDGGAIGQVLKLSSAGLVTFQDDATGGGGGGLSNVVEDLTPQLGGPFDVNGQSIVSASDGNVVIAPDGTGRFIADGITYPATDGSANHYMRTNGSAVASFGAIDDAHVTAAGSATNYTPSASTVEGHLAGIDTALGAIDDTDDQTASEVEVAASPTNYSTGDGDVEAHLAGIDTALGTKSNKTRDKNQQTGTSYTFVLTDNGKVVTASNGSAQIYTIPPNASVAFPFSSTTAAQIDLVAKGAGVVTIQAGTGVTLNGVSEGSCEISAQFGMATLIKDDTNTWIAGGQITAVS